MAELLYKDLSYEIIGTIFKVFNELGYGYQEKYYQKALSITFDKEGTNYTREKEIKLSYKDENIGKYFLDFIVENKIVLEIKIDSIFRSRDIKQILSYLKSSGLELGILILITPKGIKYKRIINIRHY